MIGQMKYLVPTGSAIRSVADVDTSGHRVAVPRGSVQEQYLRGNLKRAQFILVSTNSEALELLGSGKAHAYLNSGNTMNDAWLAKRPGFRLVEGGVAGAGSALAVAKGRPAGLAYAREFVEHLKASGFIQQAIERNGLRSVVAQRGDAE